MNDRQQFFAQFKFDPAKAGLVGVEREQFVIDPCSKTIVPLSKQYLDRISELGGAFDHSLFNFGYELSACQLESKIGPCALADIYKRLHQCEGFLRYVDAAVSLGRVDLEIAPANMPLDIYPDPTGRYQVITKKMPQDVLSAACRVAATHIHVGMPDLDTAIRTYNKVIGSTDELISIGDGSSGERMALYKVMAKRFCPEPIGSPDEFYAQALAHGFTDDPRQCWTMIRISVHGTIEFRMFGATGSIEQVSEWVGICHKLCS